MTMTMTPTTNIPTITPTVTPRSIAAYRLPRRFDVHQVERVTAEISALDTGSTLAIDGTDVEMIDLSALAALDDLADARPELCFSAPSVALRATMAFTGHDRLSARCTVSTSFAAAA